MDRRHLAYFIAVVEAGSISEAARRMHLSQPSVSQAIKELERELRTPLIERGRTLTLTPAGRALVGPARRTLRAFDGVRAAVEQVDRLTTGVLDLAVGPALGVDPAVPLITRFSARYPGVRLRVHDAAPDEDGLDRLRRGEAELLLHTHAAAYPKYRSVRLPLSESFAVFPPGTGPLPDGRLGLAELVGRPVLMGLAQQAGLRAWFAAELADRELPPLSVVVETAHRDAIIPLVLAGVGATLLPESEARAAERLGAIVRPLDFTVPRACYLLHRGDPLSPAAQAFFDLAQSGLEHGRPPSGGGVAGKRDSAGGGTGDSKGRGDGDGGRDDQSGDERDDQSGDSSE
ncbi:LysR family transcriptional regulator [Streptomyces sp. NPDC051018]|uniref:LysR family transcriptional regulator n=1 Tax=Streptomyces sp. NPDC051018 TaxID=3365639 RepID=UPI003788DDE2